MVNSSAPTVSDIETTVRSVAAEALGLPDVRPDDNLLDLGVDSLVATRIVATLRTQYLVDIPLIDVFDASDVRDFAERVFDLLDEED
jgi:acyl carrier protein